MPDLREKFSHRTRNIPRLPAAGPFMPTRTGASWTISVADEISTTQMC